MSNAQILSSILTFVRQIEPFYVLGVIGVGLVTNSLSFLVFACKKLNFEHANHILASIAVSDNLFLLSLLVVNLGIFRINAINQWEPLCKLTVYSGYVSSFVSVWLVVWFTFERFVAVVFPLRALQFGRQRPCILVIVLVGAALYSLTLVTSGIEQIDGHQLCVTLLDWYGVMAVFSLLDTTITMFLPFLIISSLNCLIIIKLLRSRPDRLNGSIDSNNLTTTTYRTTLSASVQFSMRRTQSEPFESICHITRPLSSSVPACQEYSFARPLLEQPAGLGQVPVGIIARNLRQRRAYERTTQMLILISAAFLILNTPMILLKLRYFAQHYLISEPNQLNVDESSVNETVKFDTNVSRSQIDELAERIACYMYYFNHSINFFLYSLSGSKFREKIFTRFSHSCTNFHLPA
nr:G protein-coupled receptor [Proales similis]